MVGYQRQRRGKKKKRNAKTNIPVLEQMKPSLTFKGLAPLSANMEITISQSGGGGYIFLNIFLLLFFFKEILFPY